jgi:hypothetical protein
MFNMKRRHFLEALSVDGKIILKWILNTVRNCGLDYTPQDRDMWRGAQ